MITTLALSLFLTVPAASAQAPAKAPAPAAAPAQPPTLSTVTLTLEAVYAMSGLRDPLVPSTVYGDSTGGPKKAQDAGGAASSAVAPGTFTVYNLAITGIMEDSSGRQALLRDTATGQLYVLKAGKLRDSKKKPVPGVTGVVKHRQVVLMTEDKKVHQISLPEKE